MKVGFKIILIILVVLFLFLLNFYQKNIKNFFYSISLPIEKFLWQKGKESSDIFETIFEAPKLKIENRDLRLKNQELLQSLILLSEFKKENEILRKALGIGLEKEFKLIFSDVIGKDILNDYILINKGVEDGVSKELAVITEEKVLVGKIDEVYKNFSRVILISNPQISVLAEILEKEKNILVKGKGNSRIFADFIPLDLEILIGDVIFTSSAGRTFPKGLLIGVLKEIKKEDIEPFQQAEITPFFNLSQMDKVFIIKEF